MKKGIIYLVCLPAALYAISGGPAEAGAPGGGGSGEAWTRIESRLSQLAIASRSATYSNGALPAGAVSDAPDSGWAVQDAGHSAESAFEALRVENQRLRRQMDVLIFTASLEAEKNRILYEIIRDLRDCVAVERGRDAEEGSAQGGGSSLGEHDRNEGAFEISRRRATGK